MWALTATPSANSRGQGLGWPLQQHSEVEVALSPRRDRGGDGETLLEGEAEQTQG